MFRNMFSFVRTKAAAGVSGRGLEKERHFDLHKCQEKKHWVSLPDSTLIPLVCCKLVAECHPCTQKVLFSLP